MEQIGEIEHSNCTVGLISCNKTEFHGEVDLSAVTFTLGINIGSDSKFHKKVAIDDCVVKPSVIFSGVIFNSIVEITNSVLGNCRFSKCTFTKGITISKSVVEGSLQFDNCTIDKLIMPLCSITEHLSLTNCTIEHGLDFGSTNINGSITTASTKIIDFPFIQPEYLELETKLESIRSKRETFRKLKNSAEAASNNIDAVTLHHLEQETYRIEIKFQLEALKLLRKRHLLWNLKTILRIISLRSFQVVLISNNISNGHGSFWLRGVVFTVLSSILSFYFLLLSTKEFSFSFNFSETYTAAEAVMPAFVLFLNPTHDFDFLELLPIKDVGDLGFCFYCLDYVGRILISYGIYQTLTGFRRFKR